MRKYVAIIFCATVALCWRGNFVSASAPQELIVSAAASLTNALTDISKAFEQAHPTVKVTLNFAASGALLEQIVQGAPVDVFASANQKFMDDAQTKEVIVPATRHNFAQNTLILAVPQDATQSITTVADLVKPDVQRIAIGDPQTVPAGQYAQEALQGYGVWDQVTEKFIYADSVTQVLDYLRRGEVDAGIVYATDLVSETDASRMALKLEHHKPIEYPLAVTKSSAQPELAGQFIDFVLSAAGQEILARFGFAPASK